MFNKVKKPYYVVSILLLLVIGCGKKSRLEVTAGSIPNDGTGLPLPTFDTEYDQLYILMEEEFNAEEVQISRPFEFNIDNKPEHWLKVYLLNPEIVQVGNDPFLRFSERVAETAYRHLTNADMFNKVEVTVEQDAEDVLGFNSVISKYLWRDSLRSAHCKRQQR